MDSSADKITPEPLHFVRGFPIAVVFKKEAVEQAMDYIPRDGDVILATYPKTGTTWMQYIVRQILTKGEDFPNINDMMLNIIPFLEMTGLSALDTLTTKPRAYKHHLPYNMVKKNPNSKIIYVFRKPEDTFVSYYHFKNNIIGPLDFDDYFEGFLSGNISYGRYFEHIRSYLEHKDDSNLLFVSYEKLKLNTKEEILRIAKFLGEEYYEEVVEDESVLNKILEHTSFEYMKKSLTTLDNERRIIYFRKGAIGDGKSSLSDEQLSKIRNLAEEVMKGTEILAEWYKHD